MAMYKQWWYVFYKHVYNWTNDKHTVWSLIKNNYIWWTLFKKGQYLTSVKKHNLQKECEILYKLMAII